MNKLELFQIMSTFISQCLKFVVLKILKKTFPHRTEQFSVHLKKTELQINKLFLEDPQISNWYHINTTVEADHRGHCGLGYLKVFVGYHTFDFLS